MIADGLDPQVQSRIVIGGGGFAGVEVAGEISDFLKASLE